MVGRDFGLSPNFFAKEWPQRELDGLAAREIGEQKVILPVWHGLTGRQVTDFSPTLGDKKAVSTENGLEPVVREILSVLRANGPSPLPPRRTHTARPLKVVWPEPIGTASVTSEYGTDSRPVFDLQALADLDPRLRDAVEGTGLTPESRWQIVREVFVENGWPNDETSLTVESFAARYHIPRPPREI